MAIRYVKITLVCHKTFSKKVVKDLVCNRSKFKKKWSVLLKLVKFETKIY